MFCNNGLKPQTGLLHYFDFMRHTNENVQVIFELQGGKCLRA